MINIKMQPTEVQKLSPKIEIGKKYYTFRKYHRILRVFPKYDGLTPAQSLSGGLCTRALTANATFGHVFFET